MTNDTTVSENGVMTFEDQMGSGYSSPPILMVDFCLKDTEPELTDFPNIID